MTASSPASSPDDPGTDGSPRDSTGEIAIALMGPCPEPARDASSPERTFRHIYSGWTDDQKEEFKDLIDSHVHAWRQTHETLLTRAFESLTEPGSQQDGRRMSRDALTPLALEMIARAVRAESLRVTLPEGINDLRPDGLAVETVIDAALQRLEELIVSPQHRKLVPPRHRVLTTGWAGDRAARVRTEILWKPLDEPTTLAENRLRFADDLEARLAKLDFAALLRRAASFVRAGKAPLRRDRADTVVFVAEFLEKHIDRLPAYLPAGSGNLKIAPLHRDIAAYTSRSTDRTTVSAAWNDLMVVIRELAADAERGSPC